MQEIAGILSIMGAIYLSLSLFTYDKWDKSFSTFSNMPVHNYGGIVGAYLSDFIFSAIGLSGYLIPVILITYGIRRILDKDRSKLHLIGVILFLLSMSSLIQLVWTTANISVEPAGGFTGYVISSLFIKLFSFVGAYILSTAIIITSFILMSPTSIFLHIINIKNKFQGRKVQEYNRPDINTMIEDDVDLQVRTDAPLIESPIEDPEFRIKASKESDYRLPSLDFLKNSTGTQGPSADELSSASLVLEKKLSDFGVQGRIRHSHPGPVVTMYEFEPAAGVKINRIVSLSDDLALSLRAPSIRVYPIPGKATIGIEVPNRNRATVFLKEIISSDNFQKSSSLLTLALGKDIFGNPMITDLSRLPHLLVAGTTGSGKSVFMNAMIISLLYKASPDEVKMLMIDPKLLELSAYANIPHLISPVITNPKEASDALKKVVFEMERRYRLLSEKGVRNIDTFNRQVPKSERLPYIVVFIDELADLMLTAPKDVENAITRLAQMARASGIHLILATQRPSVDVITGLIKANFPARISFQVTSKIDSRTILDAQGAEQLLGMGDMLFMIPGARIIRIHGAYVSEEEVRTITEFVKSQGCPEYSSFEGITVSDEMLNETGDSGERDEMYQKVIEFAESVGEVSISSIQRRFKIGYNRAARIMELLEEDKLVGPPKGAGKPRDFLGRRL